MKSTKKITARVAVNDSPTIIKIPCVVLTSRLQGGFVFTRVSLTGVDVVGLSLLGGNVVCVVMLYSIHIFFLFSTRSLLLAN